MAKSQAVSTEVKPQSAVELVHSHRADIVKALPPHIPGDKFFRIFDQAVIRAPELEQCTKRSLYEAVSKCAADGLVPDGREAALIKFDTNKKDANGNWKKVPTAQYIPMVAGLLKRARNSGEVMSIRPGLVYAAELEMGRFEYVEGTDGYLRHEPLLVGDLGPVVAAYSIAKLKDGTNDVCIMRLEELHAIRKRSRSPDKGPWATDWGEMAKKTVMRRHSKTLPMDSDLARVFAQAVDPFYDLDRPKALPAAKEAGGAAKRIAKAMTPAEAETPAQPQGEAKDEPVEAQFSEVDEPEDI